MKTLIVLTGPTGVGKTALSLSLGTAYGTEIIGADSRQIYRDIPIGTAAPTPAERAQVPHHLVQTLPLTAYYSAACYEQDALQCLSRLFETHDIVLACGGSMLYLDALCHGIDALPTVTPSVRETVQHRYTELGLPAMYEELQRLDPVYASRVDPHNTRRVLHALELCHMTGQPYSSLLTHTSVERPFRIIKIGLTMERSCLFDRINARVEQMLQQGLMAEVASVYEQRTLNALNTVGYKELFQVIDGTWTLDFAKERMKKNTRVYAKKQLTWLARDTYVRWFQPHDHIAIRTYLDQCLT